MIIRDVLGIFLPPFFACIFSARQSDHIK